MASAVLVWWSVTCVSSVWTVSRIACISFFRSSSTWAIWLCVDGVEIVDSAVNTVSFVSMLVPVCGVCVVGSCWLHSRLGVVMEEKFWCWVLVGRVRFAGLLLVGRVVVFLTAYGTDFWMSKGTHVGVLVVLSIRASGLSNVFCIAC
jgi:hypothetical protein